MEFESEDNEGFDGGGDMELDPHGLGAAAVDQFILVLEGAAGVAKEEVD